MEKQIIAALEIADQEVRLLVGIFLDTRLNILKTERSPLASHASEDVVKAVQQVIGSASRSLKCVISRVVLVVDGPSVIYQRKKTERIINGPVSRQDLLSLPQNLMLAAPDGSHEVVNVLIDRVLVNGSVRRHPEGELCDRLEAVADVYALSKEELYAQAMAVERAGCEIIDVCLASLGFMLEAGLTDASDEDPIIAINLASGNTSLGLMYQGRLVSVSRLDIGTDTWIRAVCETYELPVSVVRRLIYDHLQLNREGNDSPIYIWGTEQKTRTLTDEQLLASVQPLILTYAQTLAQMCAPIIDTYPKVRVVFSGEGAVIAGLDEQLSETLGIPTQVYRPSTFGARDPVWTALLGAFYYDREQAVWRERDLASIDMEEFALLLSQRREGIDESITSRLKHLFTGR